MNPVRCNAIPCVSEQGIISIEQGIKSSDQGVYESISLIRVFRAGPWCRGVSRKKPGIDEFSLAFADLSWYSEVDAGIAAPERCGLLVDGLGFAYIAGRGWSAEAPFVGA